MTTQVASRSSVKNLFDKINLPVLALIAICFFLPLCEVNCGTVQIKFSGVNLAVGTEPTIVGLPFDAKDMKKDKPKDAAGGNSDKDDFKTDPLLLGLPILAVIGIILVVLKLKGAALPRVALAVPGLLIAGLLIYFMAVGFNVEKQVAAKNAEKPAAPAAAPVNPGMPDMKMPDIQITSQKTAFFYLALIASLGSAGLALFQPKPPTAQWAPTPPEGT